MENLKKSGKSIIYFLLGLVIFSSFSSFSFALTQTTDRDSTLGGIITIGNLVTGFVNTTHIEDRTLTSDDLADSSINTTHILDSTIVSGDISDRTLTSDDLADSSVNNTHILDGTITISDLQSTLDVSNYTISGTEIVLLNHVFSFGNLVSGFVNTTHILDSTIQAIDIAKRTITANEIADSSINTTHILDGTILAEDLISTLDITNYTGSGMITVSNHDISSSAIPRTSVAFTNESNTFSLNQIFSSTIDVTGLATIGNFVTGKINTTHILDSTIQAIDIAKRTITANELADSSVNSTHIVDSTIISSDISDRTITADDLADSSVNTTHLTDIFPSRIGSGRLTIQAGTTSALADTSNTTINAGDLKTGDMIQIDWIINNVGSNAIIPTIGIGDVSANEFTLSIIDTVNTAIGANSEVTGTVNLWENPVNSTRINSLSKYLRDDSVQDQVYSIGETSDVNIFNTSFTIIMNGNFDSASDVSVDIDYVVYKYPK